MANWHRFGGGRALRGLLIAALLSVPGGCGLDADQLGRISDGAPVDSARIDASGEIHDGGSFDTRVGDVPAIDAIVVDGTLTDSLSGDVRPGDTAVTDVLVCPPSCDDANPCTADACVAGSCTHTNVAGPCDDGNACNGADTCSAGTCSMHTMTGPDCDDRNPCTTDSCAASICAHVNNAAACNDGNPCNGSDTCAAGACSVHAGALNCDDSNPCTTDSCGATGCAHANNTAACPGGMCNGAGSCVGCAAGAACSTGNPCTRGAVSCPGGACSVSGNAAAGTVCPGGTCNGSGVCMPTTSVCGGGTLEVGPPDYSRESTGTVPAGASSVQQMALVRANHWRTSIGVAPLNGDARLNTSSTNHSNFCNSTPQAMCWPGSHDETSTCAGYTGHWPWDRMTAAGYSWSAAGEDMAFVSNPVTAVDQWIWTVYHRTPFLSISYVNVGYGQTGSIDVADFGASGGATATGPLVGVFPAPGQTAVPRSFGGNEGPQPPPPPGGYPSGPVISASLNANGTVTDHQLWDPACTPIAHVFSNNDGFGSTNPRFWFFYANTPLAANTRYIARVGGTVGATSFTHTWAFTTGP